MRLEDDVVLEPQELCDLTNYVLGYSVADRFSRRIEVFVVKTWEGAHRHRVQRWCEAVLRFQGVLAGRKIPGSAGRPPSLMPPSEIRWFCGSTAEVVARIVGVDKKTVLRWLWAEKFSRTQAHTNGGQDSPNLGLTDARLMMRTEEMGS
jgi:hypothetical protein